MASRRLANLIEAELAKRGLNCPQAAREARLPADAFRTVLKGHKPNIDRAEELCKALGISMTIGTEESVTHGSGVDQSEG